MTTTTRHDGPDTHRTPTTDATWRTLATKARPDLEGKPLTLGPVQEGEAGVYAARRVWWPSPRSGGREGWSSALVVAGDESNDACPRVRLEGVDWWPRTAWGCYHGCGPDCERHGDGFPS